MRVCKAVIDTCEGGERCARKSGHKPPHRTVVCRWTLDETDLGNGCLEWTNPRVVDAGLFREVPIRKLKSEGK